MTASPHSTRTAFLIPTHNGAQTITTTIASALAQADVFVVDDGSIDSTSDAATEAGAHVLQLAHNVGKANAIREALDQHWPECANNRLSDRYDYVAILDDDVVLDEMWLIHTERNMTDERVAAVEGYSVSFWPKSLKWNGWVAARAMTTWRLQRVHTPLQIATGSKQWLIGAHVLYRASVLDQVARSGVAFAVEDMDYLWQIKRSNLGSVKFERKACALWQQATSFRDIYHQHLRWTLGYWQTIRFHRAGLGVGKHDRMCALNLVDMAFHLAWPGIFMVMLMFSTHREVLALGLLAIYATQGLGTAWVLRRWQCLVLWPYLIVLDLVYRILVMQGFVAAIRTPFSRGNWVSPERVTTPTDRPIDGVLAMQGHNKKHFHH